MTDVTARAIELLRDARAMCDDGDGQIDSERMAARIDALLAEYDARPAQDHPRGGEKVDAAGSSGTVPGSSPGPRDQRDARPARVTVTVRGDEMKRHIAKLKPAQQPMAYMDPSTGEVCRAAWLRSHAREADQDRYTTPLYADPVAVAERDRLAAEVERQNETLRRIRRTAEMSAGIMRDRKRTGGWEGAERVARGFDRIAALAAPKPEGGR